MFLTVLINQLEFLYMYVLTVSWWGREPVSGPRTMGLNMFHQKALKQVCINCFSCFRCPSEEQSGSGERISVERKTGV